MNPVDRRELRHSALLHATDVGRGPRVVLLLHGMMGSAESWHRVAPELVANGFRVLALDLPGHGLSYRDPDGTVESAAAAVTRTVRTLAPDAELRAIGHSFGGTVLAAASDELRPSVAVYVDTTCAFDGEHDRAAMTAEYQRGSGERTRERLLASRPFYSAADARVEARAARRFDPATAASVSLSGSRWTPAAGSIVLRADPSVWVDDDDARALRSRGVDVRDVPGAAHTIWYSHFDAFLAALPELFG